MGFQVNTGRLEGVNNKIKVIKRKAYGLHDLGYFSLKIIQAFTNRNGHEPEKTIDRRLFFLIT